MIHFQFNLEQNVIQQTIISENIFRCTVIVYIMLLKYIKYKIIWAYYVALPINSTVLITGMSYVTER